MNKIELISPRVVRQTKKATPAPVLRYTDLAGKRVAFLNQGKPRFSDMFTQMGVALKEEHGVRETFEVPIPVDTPAPKELLDRIVQQADVVIVGFGN